MVPDGKESTAVEKENAVEVDSSTAVSETTTPSESQKESRWARLVRWQWLLLLLSLLVGLFAGTNAQQHWTRSSKSLEVSFPRWTSTTETVQLSWPGASTERLRKQLWLPLRQRLKQQALVRYTRSSLSPGLLVLTLERAVTATSSRRFRHQLSPLFKTLPAGVRWQWGAQQARQLPVWTYRLHLRAPAFSPKISKHRRKARPRWTLEELYALQERYVRPWLRSLPGVEKVVSQGRVQRRFLLRLRPARPLSHLSDKALLQKIRKLTQHWNPHSDKRGLFLDSHRQLSKLESLVLDKKGRKIVTLGQVVTIQTRVLYGKQGWLVNGVDAIGGRVWLSPDASVASVMTHIQQHWPRQARLWMNQAGHAGTTLRYKTLHGTWHRRDQLHRSFWPLVQVLSGWLALLLLVLLRRWRLTIVLLLLTAWNALLAWWLLSLLLPLTSEVLTTLLWSQVLVVGLLWQVGGRALALLHRSEEFDGRWYFTELSPVLSSCLRGVLLLALCWGTLWWVPTLVSLRLRPLLTTALVTLLLGTWTTCVLLPFVLRWVMRPPPMPAIPWRRFLPYLNTTSVIVLLVVGMFLLWQYLWWLGMLVMLLAFYLWVRHRLPEWMRTYSNSLWIAICAASLGLWSVTRWWPLGWKHGFLKNLSFVGAGLFALLLFGLLLQSVVWLSTHILLRTKRLYVFFSLLWLLLGFWVVLGSDRMLSWVPVAFEQVNVSSKEFQRFQQTLGRRFLPGLTREWMPASSERWWLWQPHLPAGTSQRQVRRSLQQISLALKQLPEVEQVLAHHGLNDTGGLRSPGHKLTFWLKLSPAFKQRRDGLRFRHWRRSLNTAQELRHLLQQTARLPGVSGSPLLPLWRSTLHQQVGGLSAPLGLRITARTPKEWQDGWRKLRPLLAGLPWIRVWDSRVEGPQHYFDRRALWDRQPRSRWQNNAGQSFVLLGPAKFRQRQTPVRPTTRPTTQKVRKQAKVPVILVQNRHQGLWEGRIWLATKTMQGRLSPAVRLQRWLWLQQQTGRPLAQTSLRIEVLGLGRSQWKNERFLLVMTPILVVLILLLLGIWQRSMTLALFVAAQAGLSMVGGVLVLWLLSQPWFGRGELLGVSFRSLFSLQPLNLSLWTWIGFAGVVGLALLEGLLWSSAWAQWWQGQEPSSTRLVRQGLWKLGRVMMSWSLRLRVLLLGLALPLLTWQGAGQSSLHALLWPLLGGWLFGLWTLWWMPALLGWRAERRLKKQARHS